MKERSGKSDGALETMQKAASQIEQAAQESAGGTITSRGAMRVVVESSRFNIKDYLWSGTMGLLALIGQSTVVVFLTYFLMLSGDTFRRKLIKLAGPTLTKKKITLQALNEITGQIQRYLQVQLLTSALVGVLTGLAFFAIGLENAAVWGIGAAVLNLVPYIGSLATAAAAVLVGFLQFGSLNMALVVGGASLVIHTLVGNLLTPWLTSRAARMSPVAVFVGLLAWGWLWGVWGLLLGIPILMMIKSVCDRVDDLKPIGEFLGA
jgi:predicted PurR-regulated permease PerM